MMIWLMGIALLVVLGLAAYAGWLLYQVRQQRQKVEAARQQRLASERAKYDYIVESCQVIARHVVEGELNISEAAIRLKVLLDNLALSDIDRQRFIAFERLFSAVKELDTHEHRAALAPEVRKSQDKIRHQAEFTHRSAVVEAAEVVTRFDFGRYRP